MSRGAALLALTVALVGVVAMPGEFLDGDPNAWREEARSLLVSCELSVPASFARGFGEPGQYFVRNERDGRYYSKYGLMNSLMSLPPLWAERLAGGDISAVGTYPSLLAANLWNLILCVALALLLYRLGGAYTRSGALRAAFVLATLYCSALWFYERAQSSEIYQLLLFAALFLCLREFLARLEGPRRFQLTARGWLWLAGAWLCAAALVYTRLAFALLLPVIAALVLYRVATDRTPGLPRSLPRGLVVALVLPPALIVAGLAWIDLVKFGSPWLTGYDQWRVELHRPTWRVVDGLWGFLFAPRFSLFLHYPLLVGALFAAPRFWRRHRIDAIAMAALFLPFLLFISALPIWAGEASYGPRYLLFAVPVLSLPAIAFAEHLVERWRRRAARAAAVAALACLAYSAYLQVQVNRLGFLTYYAARTALEAAYSDAAADYFRDRNVGVISADLLRHRDNLEALSFFPEFKRRVRPEIVQLYLSGLRSAIDRGNWYWTSPRR
jgi:hypothetical protein